MATMLVGNIPNQILTVFSRDAMFAAYPQLYFRNFVEFKQQLGAEPGETIQFLRVNDVAQGGVLANETTPIPKQRYTDNTVQLTVNEYGNAIQFSKRALEASFRPLMQDASSLLGRDYGIVLDNICRNAFLATANRQFMATANTEGAAIGNVGGAMTAFAIKNAIETLKTMNAPMIVRGTDQFYVCIAHPHQIRSLRDDPNWVQAARYFQPGLLFNGEVGRYENTIFLETTQMPIVAGAGVAGADVYRSVIFGQNPVGFGETVPMGLLNDGVEDFGRLVSIGWYSIFGATIVQDYIVEIDTI